MIPAEYELVSSAIHDAYLFCTGATFPASDRDRVISNFDKVRAALSITGELPDDVFKNKLSTLKIVCEIYSRSEVPPDRSLRAFETFIKNYESLYSP